MKKFNKITPEGTKDILFEECLSQRTVSERLTHIFKMRGYNEVITPGMEYYDVFDAPNAAIPQYEMYKSTDNKGRLIVFRPDLTLPIARLTATRLQAMERLNVRTGGYDCTMYGGMCGAGMDNIFYANGKIFICGNCIDLPFSMPYDTPLNEVSFDVIDFDRNCCFKEVFTG